MTATQQLPADFLKLREQRDGAAAEAQAFSRQEIQKRLHLRCLELAMELQRQNNGEVLTSEQLLARAEMIRVFVEGTPGRPTSGPAQDA